MTLTVGNCVVAAYGGGEICLYPFKHTVYQLMHNFGGAPPHSSLAGTRCIVYACMDTVICTGALHRHKHSPDQYSGRMLECKRPGVPAVYSVSRSPSMKDFARPVSFKARAVSIGALYPGSSEEQPITLWAMSSRMTVARLKYYLVCE